MDAHKRILGIIYIISGVLEILIFSIVSAFLAIMLPFMFEHSNEMEGQWALVWLVPFLRVLFICLIFLVSVPSILTGFGLLNQKKWALTVALILGCFKLFSFPVGTAIGVYTIWVYTEDHKLNSIHKPV